MITKLLRGVTFLSRSLDQYLRFSGDCWGCSRGVFETFEQAMSAAPRTKNTGWDTSDLAKEFYQKPLYRSIRSFDYPILFWLSKLLRENQSVFDFGGSYGIHFFAYDKHLGYPSGLRWVVCDLPEITRLGQEKAKKEGRSEISFTNDLCEASGKDIFISSGSIQYADSFFETFSQIPSLPPHLLINRVPLYPGKTFVTLQNCGRTFCAEYIFNEEQFISSFVRLGYVLVDRWVDLEDACLVPFHPKKSIGSYSGLYFKLGETKERCLVTGNEQG